MGVQLSLRNDYDTLPAAGARSLDTTNGADVLVEID